MQQTELALDTWSGKMSPERSAATKVRTSASSSKKRQKSQTKPPLFLDLTKGNGLTAEPSWVTGFPLHGELWTRNISEFPSVAVESRLSQILEDNPHPKYFLSSKACLGILRRAERRGKELPEMLKRALERQGAPSGTAQVPAVVAFTQNQREEVRDLGDKAGSIAAESGMHQQTYVATVFDARGNGDGSITTYSFQRTDELKESHIASTQSARQYKSPTDLVVAVDCRNGTENPDINGTLQAKPNGGTSYNLQNTVRTHQSVRRLTPLECERLQGYEDNWTNIPPQTEVTAEDLSFWRTVWNEWQEMNGAKPKTDKQIIKWLQSEPADSARYKALGNSIALPPWRFVLSRIHKQGARTMASLFDGIGGFPKIWQELGGQTLWCSEVEPYPIAVTKSRFKEGT